MTAEPTNQPVKEIKRFNVKTPLINSKIFRSTGPKDSSNPSFNLVLYEEWLLANIHKTKGLKHEETKSKTHEYLPDTMTTEDITNTINELKKSPSIASPSKDVTFTVKLINDWLTFLGACLPHGYTSQVI